MRRPGVESLLRETCFSIVCQTVLWSSMTGEWSGPPAEQQRFWASLSASSSIPHFPSVFRARSTLWSHEFKVVRHRAPVATFHGPALGLPRASRSRDHPGPVLARSCSWWRQAVTRGAQALRRASGEDSPGLTVSRPDSRTKSAIHWGEFVVQLNCLVVMQLSMTVMNSCN